MLETLGSVRESVAKMGKLRIRGGSVAWEGNMRRESLAGGAKGLGSAGYLCLGL